MTETVPGSEPAIAETPVESTEVPADAAPAVTDADESQDPKRKPGAEARISELTRLRRDAERDRDYWREQASRQLPAQPAAEPEAPEKAPKLADFDFDEAKYQDALDKFYTGKAAKVARDEFRKAQAELTQKQRQEEFGKRERTFASKHADYEELTRDRSLPISQTMADLARESELGPQLLYYLASNRDEAAEIAQMDERNAARAIGRIESKLETKPAPSAPRPRPVSEAPPPPPQIEATEPTVAKDPSQMSDAEFAKWRKRQIAQRR